MKIKTQIKNYLSGFRAASVADKTNIEKFLREKGIECSVILKKTPKPTITYEEFVYWYHKELPSANDAIFCDDNHSIGIVQSVDNAIIKFGVLFKDNELCFNIISPLCDYRQATEEEVLILQESLYNNDLQWSAFYKGVVDRKSYECNQQVRISRLGKTLGMGIFKEVLDGDIIMFCVAFNDGTLKYGLNENIGKEKDYQLDQMTMAERDHFADILATHNKKWNPHQRRIDPVKNREVGQTYYYINEYNEIITQIDRGTNKHIKRWRNYNYFTQKSEAEEMQRCIIQKRQKQLIDSK